MRRRRIIAGLVVLAVAAVVAVLLWPRPPRPCRATFEQVREGMTREEIIATVGGPPGDYTGGRSFSYVISRLGIWGPETWATEEADLSVFFDEHDRATDVRVLKPFLRPTPSLLDRLRARLGL